MKDTDRETALAAGAYDQTMWNGLFRAHTSNSPRVPGVVAIADAPRRRDAETLVCRIRFDAKNLSHAGANYWPHDIRDLSCQLPTPDATAGFALLTTFDPTDAGECGTLLANAVRISEQAVTKASYLYQTHRIYPCSEITVHKEESVEHP